MSGATLRFWVQASRCRGCLPAGPWHRLGTQASVAGAVGLTSCWHTGLVALRQVDSSLTGDHTHVSWHWQADSLLYCLGNPYTVYVLKVLISPSSFRESTLYYLHNGGRDSSYLPLETFVFKKGEDTQQLQVCKILEFKWARVARSVIRAQFWCLGMIHSGSWFRPLK